MSDTTTEAKRASISALADAVSKMREQVLSNDDDDNVSIQSSSTEEDTPNKEFSLVMSALQSTVKQNLEKEKHDSVDPKAADELHSVTDNQPEVVQETIEQMVEKTIKVVEETVEEKNNEPAKETSEEKAEEKVEEKSEEKIEEKIEETANVKGEELIEEPFEVKDEDNDSKPVEAKNEVPVEERDSEEKSKEAVNEEKGTEEKSVVESEETPKPVENNKELAITKEIPQVSLQDEFIPPTPGAAPQTPQNFDFASERHNEDAIDTEGYSENLIALNKIQLKNIKENTNSPRQQEKADEPVLRAIRHLFNNRFMKAKKLFEKEAETDPLYALGLGTMAFLKAIMTTDEMITKNAVDILTTGYSIANAQIDAATKKTVGNSVYQAMTSYYNYFKFNRGSGALPASPKPATLRSIRKEGVDFIPNGVLRAHVAKAECCLQIAIIQLLQENVMGYIKCGMNLRRAYASYSLVWQEYKRMGQVYNDFIDRDTISGIQFGIGAVHLVLSTLPQKTLRIVSAFGWKADKHLGFALLKLCVEERRIRSPMASLVLLAYYTQLTTLCPQILNNDYTQPAIETLLDAQRTYPNSAFFLYYAGRTSRLARNLTLSTQSFTYAIEISKKEWAEVEVLNVCSYEIGINYMMEHNWEEAIKVFDMLYKNKYWSPAILRYLTAACYDMMGLRTEAILAFADVPQLIGAKAQSVAVVEKYIANKVEALQSSGYQDMDMCLCAFEFLYLFTGFDFMSREILEASMELVDKAMNSLVEAEKTELSIRTIELLPDTPAPKYYTQRGTLLLLKSALYNALGEYRETIVHLNWIIDHKNDIDSTNYIVPFAYWEAGLTAWGLDQKTRSLEFWEAALKFTKYDFEFRLSMRVNLAITKADESGVPKPEPDPAKRHQQNKKEPIITLQSFQSRKHVEPKVTADHKNNIPQNADPFKFTFHT